MDGRVNAFYPDCVSNYVEQDILPLMKQLCRFCAVNYICLSALQQ